MDISTASLEIGVQLIQEHAPWYTINNLRSFCRGRLHSILKTNGQSEVVRESEAAYNHGKPRPARASVEIAQEPISSELSVAKYTSPKRKRPRSEVDDDESETVKNPTKRLQSTVSSFCSEITLTPARLDVDLIQMEKTESLKTPPPEESQKSDNEPGTLSVDTMELIMESLVSDSTIEHKPIEATVPAEINREQLQERSCESTTKEKSVSACEAIN